MKALLVYPTHDNCQEAVKTYIQHGVSAAAYPARVTVGDAISPPNCWNQDADLAERMGFSVMKTVCPTCRLQQQCKQQGYLKQIHSVGQANVVVCTQQRVAQTGLRQLSAGRDYVSIHENPISLLRPGLETSLADLVQVKLVLDRMLNDPQFLDWFGDHLRRDDGGNVYADSELAIRKERQLEFTRLLADLVDGLVTTLEATETTVPWNSAPRRKLPEGIERTLFFACRVSGVALAGQPWRFVLTAATGDIESAAIIVSERFYKGGGKDKPFLDKRVVGYRDNPPNPKSVTWFNDATTTAERLQSILGCPVQDRTPAGRIAMQRKAVQITRDITRRTTATVFQNILRGVLSDRQQFQRVGVICHSAHVSAIETLETDFRRRIGKIAYFGSGDDRSSNDWYQQCDLIIVAGTPRLPPAAIAAYLVQVGDIAAACAQPAWKRITWEGRTESGERVHVISSGYHDEPWRRAHRELVRAAIVQAIGRGRGILETGCEVLVLSNEECGLPISDSKLETVNRTAAQVYTALSDLTLQKPNKDYLGKWSVSSAKIAQATSLSTGDVRKKLGVLERLGLVAKVGERGGWKPVGDSSVPELPRDQVDVTDLELPEMPDSVSSP